jgi:hypothetical protein
MNPVRSLIVGLAVASILVVGLVFWFGEDANGVRAQSETDAVNSAGFGTPGEWGIVSPEFDTEDGHDEKAGGTSNGWGHFTVEELCLQEEVDLALAETRLVACELTFDAGQRIRELADVSGYKPSEIADILLGTDPGEGCDDPDCDHDSGSGSEGENHECDDESCDDELSVDPSDSESAS